MRSDMQLARAIMAELQERPDQSLAELCEALDYPPGIYVVLMRLEMEGYLSSSCSDERYPRRLYRDRGDG
jgi:DNA-binding IclR family transcriptional regulator